MPRPPLTAPSPRRRTGQPASAGPADERRGHALPLVYDRIKEDIIDMSIAPGQKLRAQEIALRLGVSRTPVREALARLEQEGLVLRDGGWGYTVRPISLKEIEDLFTLREVLETLTTREAARCATEEDIARLRTLLDEAAALLREGDQAGFRIRTRRFHMAIAEIAANNLLRQMMSLIEDRTRLVARMQAERDRGRPREILAENRRILEALAGGSAAVLRKAVIEHVQRGREAIFGPAKGQRSPSRLRRSG